MATSGTVYSSYAKSSRLYVTWSDAGQSTSGNYTTIKWSAGIKNGNLWYSNAVKIYSVYINGTKVSSGGTYSNLTSSKTYEKLNGSLKVPHNSDGSKKIEVKISGWFYDYGDKSGSNTFTLTTIPRASTMSCPANFTAGSSKEISITRKSTSFTHTASCNLGNTGLSATSGIATSFTYTPPLSLFDSSTYKNTTKRTGTITVQTKSGSTSIGDALKQSITVTLPENSNTKPTCSITKSSLKEYGTNYLSTYGVLISGRSRLQATCTKSTKLKADISSQHVSMSGGSVSISGSTITTGYLTKDAQNGVISYYVKDTRGFTSNVSKLTNPYTVVEYQKPSIVSFTVTRTKIDSSGQIVDDPVNGQRLKFKVDYYVDPIAKDTVNYHANTATLAIYQLKYDDSGNISDRTLVLGEDGKPLTIINGEYTALATGEYLKNKSYAFEVTIYDEIMGASFEAPIGDGVRTYARTAQTLMSFHQGDGITVGRIADTSGFNVAMDSSFEKNVSIGNATFVYDYSAQALKIVFLE